MPGLLIPYAFQTDSESIVQIDHALSASDYRCPECLKRVRLRTPSNRRTHFFHVPPTDGLCPLDPGYAGAEGQIHAQAKHILFVWLRRWLLGDEIAEPRFQGRCSSHEKSFLVVMPKPDPFTLRTEFRLPSRRRLDVALLNGDDRVTMGFEIRDQHAVSAKKAEDLPARWLELDAQSVIAAYEAARQGTDGKPCRVIRWAQYDDPACCSGRRTGATRWGLRTMPPQPSVPTTALPPATIEPPVAPESGDRALAHAAALAARNSLQPSAFATQYASRCDSTSHKVLRRLIDLGYARDARRWS